jgi:rhamnopyranosyl-N-acetylglucosaminyl-diphospho-decaprenol beta-1,3/1,4-galactofuranosyltransferase
VSTFASAGHRVCALVLTYNRKELLAECLGALLGQTTPPAAIVVFDNASSDGTGDFLRDRGLLDDDRVRLHRVEENLGSAGGYAAGIRIGREVDADWLWLMDDDAEPRPDGLERLLAAGPARDPSTVALCPAVLGPDGELDVLHRGRIGRLMRALDAGDYRPGAWPALDYASYIGLLARTDAVRATDPPRPEHLWSDDLEYSVRLGQQGALRLVPESAILHKNPIASGVETRRSRFWNRLLGTSYASAPWAQFYKNLNLIRNFVWTRQRYRGMSAFDFAFTVAAYVVKSLLYDERPLRRIPWIVRFAWYGRQGRFTPLPREAWLRTIGEAR